MVWLYWGVRAVGLDKELLLPRGQEEEDVSALNRERGLRGRSQSVSLVVKRLIYLV